MDKASSKEDQLLSVRNRILQSGVKQQKLDDRLETISYELKKSKKNSQIFMIFFLVVIAVMTVLMYYLSKSESEEKAKAAAAIKTEDLSPVQKSNKVFRDELASFRSEIVDYEKRLQKVDHFLPAEKLIIKEAKKIKIKKSRYKKRHALLTNVYRKNGVVFIEADFVEYSEGKKAIEDAIKHGEAEYDINEVGDTLYFLYDGYYINNWNPLHRLLELDDDVTYSGVSRTSKGFPVEAFQNIIKDNPLFIVEIDNGVIYSIKKQKLP